MSNFNANIIQSKIGYVFENQSLLKLAFTHSSYANENRVQSNEKLEFLGDSILNFCIAEYLFRKGGGDEGTLSVMRSKIVSEPPLARAVEGLDITQYLICGIGEERNNPHKSDAVMADLFEAVIGAVYLDSGDIRTCETIIMSLLKDAINDALDGKKPRKYTFKIIEKKHTDEHDYHGGNIGGKKAAKIKVKNGAAETPKADKTTENKKQIKPDKKNKGDAALPERSIKNVKQEKKEAKQQQKLLKQAQSQNKKAQKGKQDAPKPAPQNISVSQSMPVRMGGDYKSALQNYLQKKNMQKPEYKVTDQTGSAHEPLFRVKVYIGGTEYGGGMAGRKKDAEQIAAKEACERLKI